MILIPVVLMFSTILFEDQTMGSVQCPENWIKGTHGCYTMLNSTKANSTKSEELCKAADSRALLPTFFSRESLDEVYEILNKVSTFVNMFDKEIHFVWNMKDASGASCSVPWISWYPDRPQTNSGLDCGYFYKSTDYWDKFMYNGGCSGSRNILCHIPFESKNYCHSQASGETCPAGWETGIHGCYYSSVDANLTFREMVNECRNKDSRAVLPTITGSETLEEIYTKMGNQSAIYLNVADVHGRSEWTSWDYSNISCPAPWVDWFYGQPSANQNEERCALLNKTADGNEKRMFDGVCDVSLPVMCHIPFRKPCALAELGPLNGTGWSIGKHGIYMVNHAEITNGSNETGGWNYAQAASECIKLHPAANLPILTSPESRDEVWKFMDLNDSAWINLNDLADEGEYKVVNRYGIAFKPVNLWTDWKNGQMNPTNSNHKDCVLFKNTDESTENAKMEPANCKTATSSVRICQIAFK